MVRLSFNRVCDVMLPYESAVSHGCSFRSTCHVRFQNIKYSDGINAQLKVAQYWIIQFKSQIWSFYQNYFHDFIIFNIQNITAISPVALFWKYYNHPYN